MRTSFWNSELRPEFYNFSFVYPNKQTMRSPAVQIPSHNLTLSQLLGGVVALLDLSPVDEGGFLS